MFIFQSLAENICYYPLHIPLLYLQQTKAGLHRLQVESLFITQILPDGKHVIIEVNIANSSP